MEQNTLLLLVGVGLALAYKMGWLKQPAPPPVDPNNPTPSPSPFPFPTDLKALASQLLSMLLDKFLPRNQEMMRQELSEFKAELLPQVRQLVQAEIVDRPPVREKPPVETLPDGRIVFTPAELARLKLSDVKT